MMTGRLQGTVHGRSVEIEADGRELLLRVPDLKSAWAMRRSVSSATTWFLRALRNHGLCLRLCIGTRLAFELLPRPNLAMRLFVPSLRLL
jgi:hypothetical protein